MRPNPPRMITVVIAIVLLVIGLSLTLIPIAPLNQFLAEYVTPTLLSYGVGADTRQLGYICLAGAPVLLIIGSLFPGI